MRWTPGLVLAVILAACVPGGPRWVGENIHVVDGYWVDTEAPCLPGGDICEAALPVALHALPPTEAAQVIGASLAGHPTSFVDGNGNTNLSAFGGLFHPTIVVFDLEDGRRRVVGLVCKGDTFTMAGDTKTVVERASCLRSDFPNLRVDREPSFGT